MIRAVLLAGASSLTLFAFAAEATAGTPYIDSVPGYTSYTAPTTGTYAVDVWGAQGGSAYNPMTQATHAGGLGYGQQDLVSLTAGETVYIYVGQQGQPGAPGTIGAGGGGGSSGVLVGNNSFNHAQSVFVSAGGGGAGEYGAGVNGRYDTFFGVAYDGLGPRGGRGGAVGSPGSYGDGGSPGGGLRSARGNVGYAGAGFYDGGGGGRGYSPGGGGGSGFSGGGGAYYGGGGGGGASGGGGGDYGFGGGGGGSVAFGYTGSVTPLSYQTGDGLVEIAAVPEPSAWALMLGGFGFLGYCLRRRAYRAA